MSYVAKPQQSAHLKSYIHYELPYSIDNETRAKDIQNLNGSSC